MTRPFGTLICTLLFSPRSWAPSVLFLTAFALSLSGSSSTLPPHQRPQVHFRRAGVLHLISATVPIRISLNLSEPLHHCDLARRAVNYVDNTNSDYSHLKYYLNSHLRSPFVRQYHEQLEAYITETCSVIQAWTDAAAIPTAVHHVDKREATVDPSPRPHSGTAEFEPPRHARGAGVAVAAAGALGLAAGYVITNFGSSTVNEEIKLNHDSTAATFSAVSTQFRLIKELADDLHRQRDVASFNALHTQLFLLIHTALTEARTFQASLAALARATINPSLLPIQQFGQIIDQLHDIAARYRLHSALLEPLDLLSLPAAHSISPTGQLDVLILAPLADQAFKLHQYLEQPLLTPVHNNSDNTGYNLVFPRPTHQYIAVVTRGDAHILLTTEQLADCGRINQFFFCGNSVVESDRSASCLGGLFSADSQAIKRWCPLYASPKTWALTPHTNNSFALLTTHAVSVTIDCKTSTSSSVVYQPGQHLVHAPPGCAISCNNKFAAAASLTTAEDITVTGHVWWTADDAPPILNSTRDAAYYTHLAHLSEQQQIIDAKLQKAQHLLDQHPAYYPSIFSAANIIATFLIAIALLLCRYYCCRRPSLSGPSVSYSVAPSASAPPPSRFGGLA